MDRRERDKLIEENLPLVGYHVSELLRRVPGHVQREDLAAAGSLALVQAAQSYDPKQGVPFHRYATFRVRGAMVDELRGMDWASRGARQRAKQLDDVSAALTSQAGKAPTRDELAMAMGIDASQVEAIQADAGRRIISIDGTEETSPAIQIADAGGTPEDQLIEQERSVYLHASVAALPERLRYVVQETYFSDRQVSELAEELSVTQSRVSQLRSEALAMMRDAINYHLSPDEVEKVGDGVAGRRREKYCQEVGRRAEEIIRRQELEARQRAANAVGEGTLAKKAQAQARPVEKVIRDAPPKQVRSAEIGGSSQAETIQRARARAQAHAAYVAARRTSAEISIVPRRST